MGDGRERIERAIVEIDKRRNTAAANHHMSEYSRLGGKVEGLKLALSYLDEEVASTIVRTGDKGSHDHAWPCGLFYVGNWDGDRPRVACSCSPSPDAGGEGQ